MTTNMKYQGEVTRGRTEQLEDEYIYLREKQNKAQTQETLSTYFFPFDLFDKS